MVCDDVNPGGARDIVTFTLMMVSLAQASLVRLARLICEFVGVVSRPFDRNPASWAEQMRFPVTTICRCSVLSVVAAGLAWKSAVTVILQNSWDIMRCTQVVKHDSFEPLLVVVSFAAWHLLFYLLDSCVLFEISTWRIQSSEEMTHWKVEGLGR